MKNSLKIEGFCIFMFLILVYFIGIYFALPLWQMAGIILFSHSCLGIMLGYGLKYKEGFNFTYLEKIEKTEK